MKKHFFILFALILVISLAACRQTAAPTQPPVNTQATIDAAVAATANAQSAMQAQIDAAVNATATANALAAPTATATPVVVTATPAPAAAPTAVSEDTVATMTEDELAALIDDAVAAAYTASATYSEAVDTSTADSTVTPEEIQITNTYYADTEAAIAYAEELMQLYSDVYGDLAYDTIDELNQMESDIEALTDAVQQLNDTMTEVADMMAQGLAISEDVLAQVDAATQQISDSIANAQAAAETWYATYQSAQDARIEALAAIQPDNVTADPAAALQSVVQYAQLGQSVMADAHITADELNALAQQGANAAASLEATNIQQLQNLSDTVNDITLRLAHGDISQAQATVAQLNTTLGSLQNLPELNGVSIPKIPDAPRLDPSSLPSLPSAPHRK